MIRMVFKYFIYRKSACLLLIYLILLPACDQPSRAPRERILFNDSWFFIKGDPEGAHQIDYDHTGWRVLDLPHDWGIEGRFTREVGYKGGYLPYPGTGWYRKSFRVPPDAKRVVIEFDGIMRNSAVWLNGEYMGGWPYGYTSFALDLTPQILRGETNHLACVGNGDPTCTESYQSNQRSAFHGMCLLVVRSSRIPGEIKVSASVENLEGTDLNVLTKI